MILLNQLVKFFNWGYSDKNSGHHSNEFYNKSVRNQKWSDRLTDLFIPQLPKYQLGKQYKG